MAKVTLDSTNLPYGCYTPSGGSERHLVFTAEQTSATRIHWTLEVKGGVVNGKVRYYKTGPTTAKIGSTKVYEKSRVTATESAEFPNYVNSTSGNYTLSTSTKSLDISFLTWVWYDTGNAQNALTATLNIPYVRARYKPNGGSCSVSNYTEDGTKYYVGVNSDGYLYRHTSSSDKATNYTYWYYNNSTNNPINASTFKLARTGYTFSGWKSNYDDVVHSQSTNRTAQYMHDQVSTGNKTITLTAQWSRNIYSVDYDLKGGSISGEKTEYSIISDNFTLKIPTRTGYYFTGWTGSNGSTPQRTVTIPKGSTGNKSYTANWEAKKVTVRFYTNYGSNTYTSKTYTYGVGGNFSAITRTGYILDGWNETASASEAKYSPTCGVANSWINSKVGDNKTKTVNLYAIWSAGTFQLTINPMGGTWNGTTSNSVISGENGSTKTIAPPTRPGYRFGGWYKSAYGTLNNSTTWNPLFSNQTAANLPQLYNNAGDGTVTLTLKKGDTSGGWWHSLKIKTTKASAKPGHGGFHQKTTSAAGATFIHIFRAKIPVGYSLNYHNNKVGTGSTFKWLTPNAGTGKWEDYAYELKCGSSGTFETFGYVALAETGSLPVTWYVTAAQITKNPQSNQTFTFGGSNTTLYATWIPEGLARIYDYDQGKWVKAIPYVYNNGWKEAKLYTYNGEWTPGI